MKGKSKRAAKEAHIYFPVEVFEALRKLADKNRRSLNSEVVIAVEERLQRQTKGA